MACFEFERKENAKEPLKGRTSTYNNNIYRIKELAQCFTLFISGRTCTENLTATVGVPVKLTTLTDCLPHVSGSKRKHGRGDGQDSKRLRASGHPTRQPLKRAAPSSGSKKTSNLRARHAPEDLYKDRKNHAGRGGASRADLSKGYGEKGLSRSRDSQRRIKPLLPELTEVREDDYNMYVVFALKKIADH